MTEAQAKSINIGEDVLYTSCESGIVLLNLKRGEFYQLDSVAARMWTLLLEHRDISQVASFLAAEYDSDERSITADIQTIVSELCVSELLCIA